MPLPPWQGLRKPRLRAHVRAGTSSARRGFATCHVAGMHEAARLSCESQTHVSAVQASASCAVALGLCMGEAGVSIMHDVNHGAGLRSRSARYVLGTAMDLVSARLTSHTPACCGPSTEKVASARRQKTEDAMRTLHSRRTS